MPTHVALLRGINVGGTGKVPMAELRAQLTARGFTGVATYIQSGNVVLDSADPDPAAVAARVEQVLRDHFAVPRPVVVFGRDSYAAAVAANPFPQVVEPTRLHAVFRAAPPTPDPHRRRGRRRHRPEPGHRAATSRSPRVRGRRVALARRG